MASESSDRPAGEPSQETEPELHRCFICLEESADAPGDTWVHPCTCTLEAHESCLLQWLSELDTSRNSKKMRCSACKTRYRIVEPWDPVVQLRDRLNRVYGRASPFILMSMITMMGIAGSGAYGWTSLALFGGSGSAVRWLGIRRLLDRPPHTPRWLLWRAGFVVFGKVFILNLIAPGLLLNRVLPSLGSLISIPVSFAYAASLVAQDVMPGWPPSPAWAMTLMPYVSLTYSSVYYELFGPLERRLNRALRGRPAHDEAAGPPPEQPPAGADVEAQGQGQGQGEGPADGVGATLRRLGNAVMDMLGGNDVIIDEVAGVAGRQGNFAVQLEIVLEDDRRPQHDAIEPAADGFAEAEGAPQGAAHEDGDGRQAHEQPQPGQQNPPAGEHPAHGGGNNGDQPAAAGDDNRGLATFLDITNSVVTQLLFPGICAGMGELMRVTLPQSWVREPAGGRPTGLLQQRWGRSLVGGCVFVVLRDLLNLYTKYRRVEVKKHRKIKNAKPRSSKSGASSTPAASAV